MTGVKKVELEDYPQEGWKTEICKRGDKTFGADFTIYFVIEDRDGNTIYLERDEMVNMLDEAEKHFWSE